MKNFIQILKNEISLGFIRSLAFLNCVMILLNPGAALAKVTESCFLELESMPAYQHNNFFIQDLTDYGIANVAGRVGLRLTNLFSRVPVEAYVTGNLIYDALNHSRNEVDWNNNYVYGAGCRVRKSLKGVAWIKKILHPEELNLDIFVEKLWIGYHAHAGFYVGHRPKDDFKVSLQFWLDKGNKKSSPNSKYDLFWLESGGSFCYSKSSFYVKSQKGFYLFRLNSKLGLRQRIYYHTFFEPFILENLAYDIGPNRWNKIDWQNYLQFGLGIRLQYYHKLEYETGMTNLIIGPFFEILKISYWKNVLYVPSYRPEWDYKAGLSVRFVINSDKI